MNLYGLYFTLANSLIMLINFALEPTKFYGKIPPIFIITKPLIIPFVFLHFYLNLDEIPRDIMYWMFGCFMGDIILLFYSVLANKAGCVFFFISQLLITYYYKIVWSVEFLKTPIFWILVGPPSFLLLFILYPKILKVKPLYADAIVYLISLIVALAAGAYRSLQFPLTSPEFLTSYLGHLFFIISDYFLIDAIISDTINKINIIVLPTYIIAVFLISTGVILELQYSANSV